jgi:hypothetical protein
MQTQHNKGNATWWLIGLIALAVIAYFIFRPDGPKLQTEQPGGVVGGAATQNERVVIEGEVVCLPHRDTSGPTTLECAYGLKTDDGKYYGLDASRLSAALPPEYQVGDRISVEGTLVQQSDMPMNFWNTYNVSGYIAMQDFWKFTEK